MTSTAPAPVRLRTASTTFGAQLRGFGAAQPEATLTGAELGERVGRSAEWIESRTGIRQVRCLPPGQTLIDLALAAARSALAAARSSLADVRTITAPVDLVIAASCSVRDGSEPLAPQLAAALAPGAATLDLNAACAGFSYSLATADALVRTGRASTVLIVGAEHMTGLVDPTDLGTSIIFGDGAGAAVLGHAPDDELHIGPVIWGSDGGNASLIEIAEGTEFMTMAGQKVFRWAVGEMQHVATEACRRAGVALSDIEVFVPHQANARIVDALSEQLNLHHAVVARDITVSGNTSAASIPIALTKLITDGSVKPGQLGLFLGFGAGLSYAAQVVRLP